MCVCVFADCDEVTTAGLGHLRNYTMLLAITLKDLPVGWLTDAVLQSLHGHPQLTDLWLGSPDSQIETAIPVAAFIRSERLHTHTDSCIYLQPEVD